MPEAKAAEQYGSIRLKLDAGDLAVTNGAVTLHQVGYRVEDGYRIADSFGGGMIRLQDADSNNLAQWLAESADEPGMTMLLDADGNAIFSDLEEGLYILVQTERMDGFYPIRPMLLSVPQQDQWHQEVYRQPVPVVTEIPKTGQSPAPFLGILGMLLSSAGLLVCSKKGRK
jgi:LPXTG-motif cell wall-anchored protein